MIEAFHLTRQSRVLPDSGLPVVCRHGALLIGNDHYWCCHGSEVGLLTYLPAVAVYLMALLSGSRQFRRSEDPTTCSLVVPPSDELDESQIVSARSCGQSGKGDGE